MAQPQRARIICSQCNAWYDSERELRDHMETAHRGRGPGQGSLLRDPAERDLGSTQPPKRPEKAGSSKASQDFENSQNALLR